ncbi:MAG: chorismate-binding protein [Burkholderiales bacterium]|nr:chorismate-binding protein [Burkholderiales bacterium]
MITVARRVTVADSGDVEALIARFDTKPGLWMGCDVASEGLYRKQSMACAVPALRFCVEGNVLTVTAMSRAGAALLERLRGLGGLSGLGGSLSADIGAASEVVAVLRRFLGMFQPQAAELGLFCAFSFDYYRFAETAPLPADGRRRLVAYFPERVLAVGPAESRWIEFAFSSGVADGIGRVAAAKVDEARDELAPGAHAARVARGVEMLRRAELQSLVLSQAFRRRATVSPARAFLSLREQNPYPAMFFCNLGGGEFLFGASPDLQVRADATHVESAPVCGTLRRGSDPVEDMDQALALLASDKEAAAIALCADAAANEHAAVCEPGSVHVLSHRRPYFFSTIIHAVDHLRGTRRAGLDVFDLLLAHATPATVTGLPKKSAVRAIGELEADWRGWYAGAVARLATDGSMEAYTVLRAARVAGGVAEIRTGGNILVDSDPAKEEEESQLKALTLFRVLQGAEPAAVAGAVPTRSWRCRLVACDDEAVPRLSNTLAGAGIAVTEDAAISLVSGNPRLAQIPGPIVAVGEGALWLLERQGGRVTALGRPQFARRVSGTPATGGFLGELGSFEAGWYAAHGIRCGALPEGWSESAVSAEGWVLAAENHAARACVLLFRPDSVLSLRRDAGRRALQAAFAWLDRAMFDAGSRKEIA